MKTMRALITPETLESALNSLDADGTTYQLVRTSPNIAGKMHFALWIDGCDTAHRIVLDRNATWSAHTDTIL